MDKYLKRMQAADDRLMDLGVKLKDFITVQRDSENKVAATLAAATHVKTVVDNIQVTHLEKIERMLDDNSDTQDKVVTALQSIDKGIAVISSHKNI